MNWLPLYKKEKMASPPQLLILKMRWIAPWLLRSNDRAPPSQRRAKPSPALWAVLACAAKRHPPVAQETKPSDQPSPVQYPQNRAIININARRADLLLFCRTAFRRRFRGSFGHRREGALCASPPSNPPLLSQTTKRGHTYTSPLRDFQSSSF